MVKSDWEAVQAGSALVSPPILMLCIAGAGQAALVEYPALVVEQKNWAGSAIGVQSCLKRKRKRQACWRRFAACGCMRCRKPSLKS